MLLTASFTLAVDFAVLNVGLPAIGADVGFSLDDLQWIATAAATGAYVNDDPRHLQSTGFVLPPEGTVLTAVYSSGAIGRLVPEDVVGLVTYAKQHS